MSSSKGNNGSGNGASSSASVVASLSSNSNGGALKSSSSRGSSNAAASSSAATSASLVVSGGPSAATAATGDAIWDMSGSVLQGWVQKTAPLDPEPTVAMQLWKNLEMALDSLYEEERVEDAPAVPAATRDNNDDDEEEEAELARRKAAKRRKRTIRVLHDPYRCWLQAWKDDPEEEAPTGARSGVASSSGGTTSTTKLPSSSSHADTKVLPPESDDVPTAKGGKFAHLTLGGIVNALSVTAGGVVDKVTPSSSATNTTLLVHGKTINLLPVALRLHRAAQARVHADILRTTPLRIQDMLAADLAEGEFASIRKRVYDTVILGKGIHANELNNNNDEDDLVVAVAPAAASASLDSCKKCPVCHNNDQSRFVLDRKNGDVICLQCGTVVSESIMHEGSQFRKFEGEEDRNHHGDAANPLYSNARNMSTTLGGPGGVQPIRANAGRMGASRNNNLETILRNAHAYTELNVSQFGKTDRRTRTGYKDKQKREAFVQMAHVGDALNLHEAVVQRAKELFAGFRDDRELVVQFKGVIAACLCESFDQLSQEGKAILKQDEQQRAQEAAELANAKKQGGGGAAGDKNNVLARPISSRAARRNELHHANLAGKGGLLIDFSTITSKGEVEAGASNANGNNGNAAAAANTNSNSPKASEKSAAAWNLLDCRSWLLDASRRIAQQWVEERNNPTAATKNKKIPNGSLEELEGQLVEHSIALCEQLELELQSHNNNSNASAIAAKKTITPRVTDMSRLGIKWQHSHERGSGGKGGVGGSGQGRKLPTPGAPGGGANVGMRSGNGAVGGGRSAGQILILKTAKKLGSILNDPVAGEAFHKELREVIGQQEERKRQVLRDEATRQRLQQMKRKPWLQARIQA